MITDCLPPRHEAELLDAADPLANIRDEFHVPRREDGRECVYLCGHSLGLASKQAGLLLQEELTQWQRLGVDGHFTGARPWFSYHEQVTNGLALLTGARATEVVAMNSLTVNLHLLLVSFYRPVGRRNRILIEGSAFSSDRYAVQSHLRLHGLDPASALLELVPREGECTMRTQDVLSTIQRHADELALVLLPGVQYLTGQVFDMGRITRAARELDIVIGWDLAHAIGNVPLQLHAWDADFAAWCSYKYLNAGPGGIGGAFVHERHAANADLPRLAGWWGYDPATRFQMPHDFQPAPGAAGWQISNPSVFATAPLIASLELFQRATLERLQNKSRQLMSYLEQLLQVSCTPQIDILTPRDARGAQLSLRLNRTREDGQRVFEALLAAGIVCDWREPDVIRVAPVPLYNRFTDVWDFVAALVETLQ
jgi:kynureninase